MKVTFEIHDDEGHLIVSKSEVRVDERMPGGLGHAIGKVTLAMQEAYLRWTRDQKAFQDSQG